ncbi:transposase [Streptomyces sp. NPDC060223]|uniref:transposase n=1 Tax=unclassified Streptomyces TaxID=2593676 RepID=UPI0036368A91
MLDAVRYLVDNRIKWRAMPADFPPWDRGYAFFRRWRDHALVREGSAEAPAHFPPKRPTPARRATAATVVVRSGPSSPPNSTPVGSGLVDAAKSVTARRDARRPAATAPASAS